MPPTHPANEHFGRAICYTHPVKGRMPGIFFNKQDGPQAGSCIAPATAGIRLLMLLFFVGMALSVHAQNRLEGVIRSAGNQGIPGATIFLPELNKGAISRDGGGFELTDLPDGKFRIQFSCIGYVSRVVIVTLPDAGQLSDIRLSEATVQVEEVVISGGYQSTQHENAVKIEVLKIDPIAGGGRMGLSRMLTSVPGVDMISKGSGIARPVIRGLSMNDILVLDNGVRYENYQYSSHHPLGIEESGIGNAEIIKGPASLLYGSDAIGGVINFIRERPAPVGQLIGDYNLGFYSNTLGMNTNLGIKGSTGKWSGGVRAGYKSHADFLQGGGEYAPNSRYSEYFVKTSAGYSDKRGTYKLFYDYGNQKPGLVEEEAFSLISGRGRSTRVFYQEFNTHLLSSQNKLFLGRYKLEINGSLQNTGLLHAGESDVPEIQMGLTTLMYETRLVLPSDHKSEYIIGLQGFNQRNENLYERETILLPDAGIGSYSAFGLLQHTFFDKLRLQAGMRYDRKGIHSLAAGDASDPDNYRPGLDRKYGSFSGSFGATINLSEAFLMRANLATAFRTPNLAELTSNGPHELRFERGNPDLLPEKSREADLSVHYHSGSLKFDLAAFYNRIGNYIFIAPTGEEIRPGMPVYQYRQADAALFGYEAGLNFRPGALKWLSFETTFAAVTGKQSAGGYLPFIPPSKLRFELRAEKGKLMGVKDAFVSLNTLTASGQRHPAPEEEATPGYTLVDLTLGGTLKLGRQPVVVTLSAGNLFDVRYTDHLSTLREAGILDPGRNISLTVRLPLEFIR
jgi:iron complex outermembrane receptor protein